MANPLDFQSLILRLQEFWARQGCLIWQPYYSQVGAGTLNPATALRVLGPEPWNVVYVEPSIRPDDARYGENPNRMQMHYQLQVILKPDPGNPQELYLQSLQAIGIDPLQHDFRFVEDNWESPALGAWGLGWEVWLDGQEITQFTYFQQSGGQLLDPVSVEITYGLDRIAIALQRVRGFAEIHWNEAVTCGDVNLQAEQEHSRYYFEIADVERLRQMYDLYEEEARACLAQNLILPAHDYVLKCSHTFNVLDSRGVIGVTERQAYFGRMRELSRRVAELYMEQRQRLEYPFMDDQAEGVVSGKESVAADIPIPSSAATPEPFLLEIGMEELPAGDLDTAISQLQDRFPVLLSELRLAHGQVRVLGTPRRLVVYVEGLSALQPDLEQIVKGPPAERAYDTLGQPTKAAEGFARSKGVETGDLQIRAMDGGQYVVAVVRHAGRPAPSVLSEALPRLIAGLRFDRSMRWNRSNVYFSRPIRWLLALFGEQVVSFEYAGLHAGNLTRGMRFQQPEEIRIEHPEAYFQAMLTRGIILEVDERRQRIQTQVEALAAQSGGDISPDPALLAEVTNLVEAPAALRGRFEPDHLKLPRQVLISVMKKHQRYFPLQEAGKEDGRLLPYFITVANHPVEGVSTAQQLGLVVEGNEHVIRARFADAAFFIHDDLKRPLSGYLPRLGTLTFQTKLGSMLDKSQRIAGLVQELAAPLGLTPQLAQVAQRAAEMCKADLATKMVVEMTSLQGVMGRYYALHSGESEAVALAIYEHYLPRFPGDALPQTLPGLAVGIADRLDTLAGLFAAGLTPSGTRDPFGLRRAALGLVQALIGRQQEFDLGGGLQFAAARLPVPSSTEQLSACQTFIVERLRNLLLEEGSRYDVVEAVLSVQGKNPAAAVRQVKALSAWVERPDWHTILPAYARCVRIVRDLSERYSIDEGLFSEVGERGLYAALIQAEALPRRAGSVDDFLQAFLPMIPVVNSFFDQVLVMTEEAALRNNRLALLQRVVALAAGVADFSKLEGF